MCETLRRIRSGCSRKICDLVVVECHGTPEDANKLAQINGIDLILASHLSDRKPKFPSAATNEVPAEVTQKGSVTLVNTETESNWSLGRIDLTLTSKGKIADAKHTLVYLDRRYDEDPEMVKVFDDYTEKVKNEVLSTAAKFKSDAEAILDQPGAQYRRGSETKCISVHTQHPKSAKTATRTSMRNGPRQSTRRQWLHWRRLIRISIPSV